MTTTADKIKEIEARIDSYQHTYMEALRGAREVLDQLKPQSSKPPDPAPLECWANYYGAGPSGADIVAFSSKELAETVADQNSNTLLRAIKMRQITPQMEQDKEDAEKWRQWCKYIGKDGIESMLKDAARYRKYKELALTNAHREWYCLKSPHDWDRELDRELEKE